MFDASSTALSLPVATASPATRNGGTVNAEALEYKEIYKEWLEEYGPFEYIEYDGPEGPNHLKVKEMDTEYVWTAHGTCEDDSVSNGYNFFGDPPRCCWSTYGWYVSKRQHPKDDFYSVRESFYTHCECNPDGENDEGTPDCEKCEGEGFLTYYFDE